MLATAQIRFALGVVRHVQGAFAAQLAIDVVSIHKAEHQRRRRPEHAVELTADRFAEPGLDLVRRDPHAGVDQPDVAPGAAVTCAMRFQHADAFAFSNRCSAADNPVNPAPITQTSTLTSPRSAALSGRCGVSFPTDILRVTALPDSNRNLPNTLLILWDKALWRGDLSPIGCIATVKPVHAVYLKLRDCMFGAAAQPIGDKSPLHESPLQDLRHSKLSRR